jgi:putative ABC transport system permease protein
MVIGGSMNAASLTLARMRDEMEGRRDEVEAALALGSTSRQAADPILKTSLRLRWHYKY